MSCCGAVLYGPHVFGCEDAESEVPRVWPATRDDRIVWLTDAEEKWGGELHHASEREATEHLEAAA